MIYMHYVNKVSNLEILDYFIFYNFYTHIFTVEIVPAFHLKA